MADSASRLKRNDGEHLLGKATTLGRFGHGDIRRQQSDGAGSQIVEIASRAGHQLDAVEAADAIEQLLCRRDVDNHHPLPHR